MRDIDRNLYAATQVRELDRRAIEVHGIDGYSLMQRAAASCWAAIRERSARAGTIVIVCGPGNNGGDGYEIARLAKRDGWMTFVYSFADTPRAGDALKAYSAWCTDGGTVEAFSGVLADGDWVVDAMFGTGLARTLADDAMRAVDAVAALRAGGAKVLAVDVPTGLDATTGSLPSGRAVQADITVSFIGQKFGVHAGRGPAISGERRFDDLGVPAAVHDGMQPLARLQADTDLQSVLAPRARDSHKGDHGHVLIVGGNHGMMGAALIAGRAALRAGAGLVSVATRSEHAAVLTAAQAELMSHACDGVRSLRALIDKADVIAIGPGLGSDTWARSLFATVLESDKPAVLDADALNLLSADPVRLVNSILTPHPGEAARLLGCSTAEVQGDRLAALQAIERRYAATVVLKGAGSLISGAPAAMLCPFGNPGMAVGGMGDALTGIIAALCAQGLAAPQAAQTGVLVHALAGDRAALNGERGLLPDDVIAELRFVGNPGRP